MTIFNRLLTTLSLLLLWTVSWTQPASAAFAPTEAENALLWKISSDEMTEPSYLFGTIHMIPAESYVLTEATQSALESSSKVAFEIDTEEMTNPAALMGLLSKMYMANDTSLEDLLNEEDYALVDEHFQEIGLPLSFMGKIKPMFLTILAGEDMQDFDLSGGFGGADGIKSYELELTEMAKEQEKPIVGLETAEFQMSLFDSIPYKAQAEMLVEMIKADPEEAEEEGNTLDRMIELYVNEDIVGMQTMMGEESSGIEGFEDLLLVKRNRNWIPVMEGLMAEDVVFFAVGAGHLAGEQGVIALLREAGYTMEPIR